MRGWAIGLMAVLVGGGAWLLGPWGDDEVTITGANPTPRATEPEPSEVPPQRTDLGGAKPTSATDPTQRPASRFRIPITLVAHAIDKAGTKGPKLHGFPFRVATDRGESVVTETSVRSGHVLELGVGSYEVHATMADRIAPGIAKFTISRDSVPVTLRLPWIGP